ncbi:MAG: hypothetical protein P1U70_24495 [Saprospiraceae bacterium]|jgi:hypothetical protein|nr:hypothetical protein [Saprospiraceae bacterium]
MKLIINLFGILILILGISLLIKPEIIYGWMEDNMESKSLYISAIIFRLVFGILLIMGAKKAKFPRVIKFIGYIAIIAAVSFIFMGHENFRHIIVSLIPEFRPYASISGLIGMALGAFLVYASTTNKEIEQE